MVVMVHDGGAGYEVEIFTLDGQTLDVITVEAGQVRPVAPRKSCTPAASPDAPVGVRTVLGHKTRTR